MFIAEFVTDDIPVLDKYKSFLLATTIMDELKISTIPVVQDGLYLGLLPEHVIFELDLFDKSIKDNLKLLKQISLKNENTLLDALNLFVQEKIDVLPIINDKRVYIGCITKDNLLSGITSLLSSEEKGSIIILTMNYNDFHLTEISKIIEDENTKIINFFLQPIPSSTEIRIVIKINKIDSSRVVKSLLRYNYNVEVIGEDTENEKLPSDYDFILKYFDI